jgi:outer membrane protein assembly factor BamE (lipoprotein component of BamABCDE complex)
LELNNPIVAETAALLFERDCPCGRLPIALGCARVWGNGDMRILGIVALGAAVLLSGCAIQRAQEALDARAQMIGMSKEQVLACMGAPVNKAAEGMTEVWGYNSGNGMTVTDASYGRFGGTAVSSSRFCNINVVMNKGQVAAINYAGPTGGLLTAGEQCAYAVDACVRHQ